MTDAPLPRRLVAASRLSYFRLAVALLVVLTGLSIAVSFATYDTAATDGAAGGVGGTLVATIDATGPGQLVAYHSNGSVMYQNETYGIYHDVDPAPTGADTVEYVATYHNESDACAGEQCSVDASSG